MNLRLIEQVAPNQSLHQLVPLQLADHAASIVVIGDIGGIFGEQLANDLVVGVVPLFIQSIEHTAQYPTHIVFIVAGYSEFNGTVHSIFHKSDRPPSIWNYYISKKQRCKDLKQKKYHS